MKTKKTNCSHSLKMGMKKDTVTLDDSLEVSFTTKHSYHTIVLPHTQLCYHTIQQAYSWHTSRYLPIYVHTRICTWTFVAILFMVIRIWKQPRYFLHKWIDKQAVVHPYNRILGIKKKGISQQTRKIHGLILNVYYIL